VGQVERSHVASPKFGGGPNRLTLASNSIWFGTLPLEAQNNKVC